MKHMTREITLVHSYGTAISSQMRCCLARTFAFMSRKKGASSTRRRARLTYSDLL